ncbi:hypothetical protein JXA48_01850 [Candidatus Woesearchaeota archaeon]|nr:hypothetical protein [Candidatus Woesearchaeota archaeon]MBN2881723.1 hypothetical protein [Candidatus Woesearchaeota archaeon]
MVKKTTKKTTKKTAKKSIPKDSISLNENPIPKTKTTTKKIPSTALAGIILGGLSFLFIWLPFFGLILAVLGLTFGILGIKDSANYETGKGLSIGAIVISSIVLMVQLFLILALSVALSAVNVADTFEGACVINDSNVHCDNLSFSLDGSTFNVNVDAGEDSLNLVTVNATGR